MINKYIKVVSILLIVILLIAGVLYWFFLNQLDEVGKSKSTDLTIGLKENIYVSARYWGLTGDHQEIVLSNSPINSKHRSYSKDESYIFYTSEIFYKIVNDSNVTIYATESSISEPVNKIPNITLEGLKTADEIRDYNTNYQKYGLERISVYE